MARKTINATLCYLKKNGQTLMLHRVKKHNDYHQGKYNGLGGKFEHGETPEECVIREIKEESGFEILNPKLHGIISFPLFDGKNDWLVFLYTATNWRGEIIESLEGNLEWIDDDKLKDLPLWEGDYIFLKWLEENRFFSAKFIYENKKLVKHQVIFPLQQFLQ